MGEEDNFEFVKKKKLKVIDGCVEFWKILVWIVCMIMLCKVKLNVL